MTAGPAPGGREKFIVIAVVFAGFAAGYACTYVAVSTTFILPLTKAFGWGRLVPALMYLSAMLGVVSASMLLGPIIQHVGEARVAVISGLCLAIIIAAHALLGGSVPVAIGLAFLAGFLGARTGVGLYVSLMPRWFNADLGRALGFAVIGQSFGSAIMPAISADVIATCGWRNAYLVLASITLLVMVNDSEVRFGSAESSADHFNLDAVRTKRRMTRPVVPCYRSLVLRMIYVHAHHDRQQRPGSIQGLL